MFSEKEYINARIEYSKHLQEKNGNKTYSWEEIEEELENETEEEALKAIEEYDKEYENVFSEKVNWTDIKNDIKEPNYIRDSIF